MEKEAVICIFSAKIFRELHKTRCQRSQRNCVASVKEVCYVMKPRDKAIHNFTHSVTDVPCGREGESYNTIREHHNNCNILLKRYCNNTSNVNLFQPIYSMERREFLLVRFSCVQRFVRSRQSAWNDLEKVVNVSQLISGPDALTDGSDQIRHNKSATAYQNVVG